MIRKLSKGKPKLEFENSNWNEVKAYIEELKRKKLKIPVKRCREINQAHQLRQDLWRNLKKMRKIQERKQKDPTCPLMADASYCQLLNKCKVLVADDVGPGPVGNSSIHDCVLLGQIPLCEEMIRENIDLVTCAYFNDLEPWKDVICKSAFDQGLYTGETVLHLAIGLGQTDFVKFLFMLEQELDLSAQTRGLFFMPRWIEYKTQSFQRFLCPFRKLIRFNPYSECYYGEFPLSFAASVGNTDICNMIFQHSTNRKAALYRADTSGNTALHMAVIHRQTNTVDWLLDREDEIIEQNEQPSAQQNEKAIPLVEAMNGDGLTPLTLAARLGFVDVFHHVLRRISGGNAWEYGKVCVCPFIPPENSNAPALLSILRCTHDSLPPGRASSPHPSHPQSSIMAHRLARPSRGATPSRNNSPRTYWREAGDNEEDGPATGGHLPHRQLPTSHSIQVRLLIC